MNEVGWYCNRLESTKWFKIYNFCRNTLVCVNLKLFKKEFLEIQGIHQVWLRFTMGTKSNQIWNNKKLLFCNLKKILNDVLKACKVRPCTLNLHYFSSFTKLPL